MNAGLFFNAHPHLDEERLMHQWLTWQPPAALVMNNPNYAMRLQSARPNALVIARQTPDDNVDQLGDPQGWLARMRAIVPDERVVLYAGNECHTDPGISAWMLEVMARASDAGRRLCILNSGTGGPEDEEWWAEMPPTAPPENPLDAYRIGALEQIARVWVESNHLLGLHEYATLLNWRAARGWQVGRYNRHLDTFQAMGITIPREQLRARLVVTEATFDSITHSWHKGARWLPAKDAARQMIEQDTEEYQGIPVLMYCLGHNSDPQWRMFRLDYAGGETVGLDDWGREFQEMIGAYMMSAQESEPVDTERMEVTVTGIGVKRRTSAAGAEIGGAFEPGNYTLQVGPVENKALGGGLYEWRYFDNGAMGWWSATGPVTEPEKWIQVKPVEVPQEPPPVDPPVDPPTEPDPPPVDDARIAALEARVAELEALIAEMEAKIGNHYRAGFTWMLEGAETFGVSTLDVIGE